LYISTTHSVVSRALVVEKEIKHKDKTVKRQFPVYSKMEKICYAVIISSRKLRHYFEAHIIKVLTNQPLNNNFGNKDSSGRINKWAMEQLEYVVNFKKHSAIKSQILADFVAEWDGAPLHDRGQGAQNTVGGLLRWSLGAIGAGAAVVLLSPSGIKLRYTARIQFNSESDKCTNNIAVYEAILLGICKLRPIRVQKCILCTDSNVVAGQIEKECIAREPTLERYLGLVRKMENYFKRFTVEYIEQIRLQQRGKDYRIVKNELYKTSVSGLYSIASAK
jgi:ribonuclease HI